MRGSRPGTTFQETGTELLGQERKLGETSPALLLPCSIGQRSNRAFLDSRRWRNRFHFFLLFVFLKLVILYWSIADEQCCDRFRWTAKGLSIYIYTYMHITILLSAPLPSRLPHNIEQSSLC